MPDSDGGAEQDLERRLATILSADVAAFSRLMAEDEEFTLRVFRGHKEIFEKLVAVHRGRVFNTAGDAILAEFGSAVEAVRCATEIQAALRTRNDRLPANRQVQFRIGINLGDVMVQEQDLLGDGVNVAARLQSAASPGGVCIVGSVYDQIRNRLSLSFKPLGDMSFKNIPQPVRTFSIVEVDGIGELPSPGATAARRGIGRYVAGIAAALLLVGLAGGGAWVFFGHPRPGGGDAARDVARDVAERPSPRPAPEPKSAEVGPPPAGAAPAADASANDGEYKGPVCFGATATFPARCFPVKASLHQGRFTGQWPGNEPGVTMRLAGDVSAGGHVTIHVHGEKADGTRQTVIDFDGVLHDGVLDATGDFANGRSATLNWRRGAGEDQAAAAPLPATPPPVATPPSAPREAALVVPATPPAASPAPATPVSATPDAADGRYGGQVCFGQGTVGQPRCFRAEGVLHQGRLSGQWPGLDRGVTMHMDGDVAASGRATIQMRGELADGTRRSTVNLAGTLHDGRLDATGAFLNGRPATLSWQKH